ncbi:putative Zinc finger A20 and AN1 domain-containing stress-associated protein 6 [Cocos nucifera]|uniref:Putative Zinc finger A20 and AN1 domain-containing stress-associated protein 6 n=1 Tax=Cocos nucifera TaxID=13894 RepID=A0A8K0I0H1_COCNU|nr:putative Zinc finger A20 and AN1 domain-containing stress-associated protein 6 [Cocos nucifera]
MVSSPAITRAVTEPTSPLATEAHPARQQQQPNRCAACRKRVGLTGFRCRCGATYCGIHRYPEGHGCGFDYKTAGRDAIARANPVVKADKLHRRI